MGRCGDVDAAAPERALVHHLRVARAHARAERVRVGCVFGAALTARSGGTMHFALQPAAEPRDRSRHDGDQHPLCFFQAHFQCRVAVMFRRVRPKQVYRQTRAVSLDKSLVPFYVTCRFACISLKDDVVNLDSCQANTAVLLQELIEII